MTSSSWLGAQVRARAHRATAPHRPQPVRNPTPSTRCNADRGLPEPGQRTPQPLAAERRAPSGRGGCGCSSRLPLPRALRPGRRARLARRAASFRTAQHVVRENLTKAFPDYDESAAARGDARLLPRLRADAGRDHQGRDAAAAGDPPPRARREPRGRARAAGQGQPVLLVAAHQCNWEWMLLGLSLELGYPVDAAYKPLVNSWAEREMMKLRTPLRQPPGAGQGTAGGHHQAPRASCARSRWWPTRSRPRASTSTGRASSTATPPSTWGRRRSRASRASRCSSSDCRRTARGYYEMRAHAAVCPAARRCPRAQLTERYARLVEAQIRAAPPDWPWSHKRWRLKKSVYQQRGRGSA